MHGVFLQAFKVMFRVVKQKGKVNGNLGEEFDTFLGVKQGDPLSTDLFGSRIPDLMFVDDVSLLCETRRSIQLGLNIIELFEVSSV